MNTEIKKDIVCGMDIKSPSKWQAKFDGSLYEFCSHRCQMEFKKNPSEYIKKVDYNLKLKNAANKSTN